MIVSKALKAKRFRWIQEKEANNFFLRITYLAKEYLIWPVMDSFRIFKERAKRSYAYAQFGWSNYDFDFVYVYDTVHFKLIRLRNSLEHGSSVQKEEDTQALNELIEIVARLREGDYESKYLDEHDKRWGEIESKTTPNYDDKGKIKTHTWHSWRAGTKDASEEVKQKERQERLACYNKAEGDRISDIDRVADILKKNSKNFWD